MHALEHCTDCTNAKMRHRRHTRLAGARATTRAHDTDGGMKAKDAIIVARLGMLHEHLRTGRGQQEMRRRPRRRPVHDGGTLPPVSALVGTTPVTTLLRSGQLRGFFGRDARFDQLLDETIDRLVARLDLGL